MVCPACGLANDPSSTTCARCNAALIGTIAAQPTAAQHAPTQAYSAPLQSRTSPRVWWIAGLAVVVILLSVTGVGVLVYINGDDADGGTGGQAGNALPLAEPTGSTPSPTALPPAPTEASGGSAQDQAAALDGVLDASVLSRRKLNQSIDKVRRCTQLSLAVSDMRAAGDERRAQLSTVDSVAVDQLPNGERLRSTLHTALDNALQADGAYLDWAEATPAKGCGDTAERRAAFGRGEAASARAGAAKTDFLRLWNPIATDLGLPTRSRQNI